MELSYSTNAQLCSQINVSMSHEVVGSSVSALASENIRQGFQSWPLLRALCRGLGHCDLSLITEKQLLQGRLEARPDSLQSAFILCYWTTLCRDFWSITMVWGMLWYILIAPCISELFLLVLNAYLLLMFVFPSKDCAHPVVCQSSQHTEGTHVPYHSFNRWIKNWEMCPMWNKHSLYNLIHVKYMK